MRTGEGNWTGSLGWGALKKKKKKQLPENRNVLGPISSSILAKGQYQKMFRGTGSCSGFSTLSFFSLYIETQ